MSAGGSEVVVMGIRHHGPGSARSVATVLDGLRPDVVVIEGPPELEGLIPLAASPDLVPPVAALVYRADDPGRASFYPFAAFSPEWVALRWALDNDATARFADLPAANALALPRRGRPGADGDGPEDGEGGGGNDPDTDQPGHDQPGEGPVVTSRSSDPISALAEVAGYDDPERWWEDAIEHRTGARDGFVAISDAVADVRAADGGTDLHNARREAAMRKVLRAVLAQRPARVAVVCGAFHAPALQPDAFPTIAADTALLKGLRRTKVAVTWAPWTARRLAYDSGYGAGVTSPGWYAHCFATPTDEVVDRWMVGVARALRRHDLDASSAQVIDAARLARTLAALRGRPLAGLAECTDAVQSTLCGGATAPLSVIHDEVVVGRALGRVPDDTPQVPLARDLEQQRRSARLTPRDEPRTVTIDLRTDAGLRKSVLLHRLDLLDIRWGVPVHAGGTTGTFKEAWQLQWQPELTVAVIEAGMWGTTVATAAEARAASLAGEASDLEALGDVLSRCLPADLPQAVLAAVAEIERRSAAQHDTLALMRATEPLARSCRYGDVRQLDTTTLRQVFAAIIDRVAAGVAAAVTGLDDEAADAARTALDAVQRAVSLLADDDPQAAATWTDALTAIATTETIGGSIGGRVVRLLRDQGRTSPGAVADRLSRELSPARPARSAAAFLDGFLDGDATLLLLDHDLLALIDTWVAEASEATFDDLLPLLRRTFSRYDPAERRSIGQRLRTGAPTRHRSATAVPDDPLASAAVARVLALLDGRSG
jgi:hypothetical protein